MSTVTMTFYLPEDAEELQSAQQGAAATLVLRELDEVMRRTVKDAASFSPKTEAIQILRGTLRELCEEYHVVLE